MEYYSLLGTANKVTCIHSVLIPFNSEKNRNEFCLILRLFDGKLHNRDVEKDVCHARTTGRFGSSDVGGDRTYSQSRCGRVFDSVCDWFRCTILERLELVCRYQRISQNK